MEDQDQRISPEALRDFCADYGMAQLLLRDRNVTIARQAAHIAELEAPALLHRERGSDPSAAGAPASLRPKPPRGPRSAAADEPRVLDVLDEALDPVTRPATSQAPGA